MLIGFGYDVHRLVPGRPLVLGGVTIPGERGLEGHSDADVVLHALMDALSGRRRPGRHRHGTSRRPTRLTRGPTPWSCSAGWLPCWPRRGTGP